MKVFEDPRDFVTFLEENEVIKSVTPFADELINLHAMIPKGCKCREKSRIAARDGVYMTMLNNVIEHNAELQSLYKKYGGFDSAQWKLNGNILLEI